MRSLMFCGHAAIAVFAGAGIIAAAACVCGAEVPAAHPAIVSSEFIYEEAPFPQCHASTIVEGRNGLVAAWFGGTREKDPDVGIWLAQHVNGKWTAPVEVANGVQYRNGGGVVGRYPCWNPVLFQPRRGPLMLFYKVGPDPRTWGGMLRTSTDGGRTWSRGCPLPKGILGPIKNKPVQLANGDILCPTSTESTDNPSKWQVYFERTGDLGRTWQRIGPVNDGVEFGAIQPSILLLGGERLLAGGRSRQGKGYQVASEDSGKTWGPMTATELPNPNSGTDAVTLQDGRHLIVYNHTAKGRSPLNVALSPDGRTWQAGLVLESERGEYSYPAVIQSVDKRVHITYTWKRQRVKHVVLDPAKLEGRAMVDGRWPE